jgi:hypothetical protein
LVKKNKKKTGRTVGIEPAETRRGRERGKEDYAVPTEKYERVKGQNADPV